MAKFILFIYNIFICMTKQEVEKSLPFKAAKKILKRTFPWITRIEAPEDAEKYSSLIFLNIFFDPYKLLVSYPDYHIDSFYKKHLFKNPQELMNWGSSALSVFFKSDIEGESNHDRYELFKPITEEVTNILRAVGRSTAFPEELKLHNNRTFDLSNFYIDPKVISSEQPSQP